MEKEITQKKWFCDVCGREGSYNGKCVICGKEYCYVCEFIGFNPTHVRLCKDHQKDDSMQEIILSFQKRYRRLHNDIEKKLTPLSQEKSR